MSPCCTQLSFFQGGYTIQNLAGFYKWVGDVLLHPPLEEGTASTGTRTANLHTKNRQDEAIRVNIWQSELQLVRASRVKGACLTEVFLGIFSLVEL